MKRERTLSKGILDPPNSVVWVVVATFDMSRLGKHRYRTYCCLFGMFIVSCLNEVEEGGVLDYPPSVCLSVRITSVTMP